MNSSSLALGSNVEIEIEEYMGNSQMERALVGSIFDSSQAVNSGKLGEE